MKQCRDIFIFLFLSLLQEQSRSVDLQTRLNSQSVAQGRVTELEQMVSDLQAEREILKSTNDRLMKRFRCTHWFQAKLSGSLATYYT